MIRRDQFQYDRSGQWVARYRQDPGAEQPVISDYRVFDSLGRITAEVNVHDRQTMIHRGLAYHQTLRVSVMTNASAKATPLPTTLLYDGPSELLQRTGPITVQNIYAADEDFVQQDTHRADTNERHSFYPALNHQRSVMFYTDENATLQREYRYTAFGFPTSVSGNQNDSLASGITIPLYTGKKWLGDDSGFYIFRYRAQHPKTGRFASRDLLGYHANISGNVYEYCASDPTNKIDAYGLMSAGEFFDEYNDIQRKEWFDAFKDKYLNYIKDSALGKCVPQNLLFSIIMNEMLDYDPLEQGLEVMGYGSSVGPAQMTVNTVISENLLYDNEIIRYQSMAANFYGMGKLIYWQDLLRGDMVVLHSFNIDLAARLMDKYLVDLCHKSRKNEFSTSFSALAAGCNIKEFCCRIYTTCAGAYNYKPPPCLASALAAMWNNGRGITSVGNIKDEAPNAFYHANNAYVTQQYVNDNL